MQIHITKDGQKYGPYPEADVIGYLRNGQFSRTDLAWQEGYPNWVPLSQLVSVPVSAASSPPPIPQTKHITQNGFSDAEILEIANLQKVNIWLIPGSTIATFIQFPLTAIAEQIAALLFIVIGIVSLVFIYKLARALRSSVAWLYAILSLIPGFGIIVLLITNSNATAVLRSKGVRVGLTGANQSDLEKLKAGLFDLQSQSFRPTAPPSHPNKSVAKKVLIFSGIVCGGVIALFFALIFISAITSKNSGNNGVPPSIRRVEDDIATFIQTAANQNRQNIFNAIHPVGTAKSVAVHDVTITSWKHGQVTNRFEDILQFTVRYTIYWEGPIIADGYTKITQTFDNETNRYIDGQILATNGATNADASYALGYIGGALLYEALSQ